MIDPLEIEEGAGGSFRDAIEIYLDYVTDWYASNLKVLYMPVYPWFVNDVYTKVKERMNVKIDISCSPWEGLFIIKKES